MAEERTPVVGQHVVFVDPKGVKSDALVTTVWGPKMINLVFVDGDETRKDSWGRQISRQGSCPHVSNTAVHGLYWRFVDEADNEYTAPLQS